MLRHVGNFRALLLALAVVALSAEIGAAQNASRPGPPITIGGFAYRYIPQGRIHMSVCQHASCVPGSKVSYTIFAPVKNPDFEGFKLAQQRVAAQLRQRVPEGTVVNFGTPKRTTDQLFTIFTNTRVVHATNGAKQFTKSTLLHSKKITISVISSSEDKEAVEANRALFMIGLMTWSQSIGKNKQ